MINRRELLGEDEQGLRKMTKIERMWEDLKVDTSPQLGDGVELECELAVLNFYMTWSIEELIECEGVLDPRMIVLLRECKRELALLLKQLDGATYISYFEHLVALAGEVLRRVKVKDAYRIVRHGAEVREMEDFYSSQFAPSFENETAVPIEQRLPSTEPLQDSELEDRKEHS